MRFVICNAHWNNRGDEAALMSLVLLLKKKYKKCRITVLIKDEWFTKHTEEDQRSVLKKVFSILDQEGVANDINGYPKAPPSIRIWGGSTVQNADIKALLPWID